MLQQAYARLYKTTGYKKKQLSLESLFKYIIYTAHLEKCSIVLKTS